MHPMIRSRLRPSAQNDAKIERLNVQIDELSAKHDALLRRAQAPGAFNSSETLWDHIGFLEQVAQKLEDLEGAMRDLGDEIDELMGEDDEDGG